VESCQADQDACEASCIDEDEQKYGGLGAAALYEIASCNYDQCRSDDACVFPICDSTFTTGDRACSECAGSACCAAVKACEKSATCLACLGDPSGPGCAASANYQAIHKCQTETCGAECAFQICGSADFGYPVSACNDCVSGSCCAQFAACTQSTTSTCYKCLSGKQTTGCDTDPQFTAYDACVNQSCKVACSGL
jgi:hypothetical protein